MSMNVIGIAQEYSVIKPEEITYDWLVKLGKKTGYTDHISHFRKIFSHLKVRTFLEFGLGYSTKYFLDSCDKVISIEFITPGIRSDWMRTCLELYCGVSANWIPIAYFSGFQGDTSWARERYIGSDKVHLAGSYQCATHKNYALIDDSYLNELDAFLINLIKFDSVDVAFVDSGIYLRGDFVQLLFGKVPVIVAHDKVPGMQDDVYGYSRIIVPENYGEIFIPGGIGTTIWVVKSEEFKELFCELTKYAEIISEEVSWLFSLTK